jgi:hypothetical protein
MGLIQTGKFALIILPRAGTFIFDLFPAKIETQRRANWEPQDITTGTKPIFYGNRDPKRLTVNEVWLDTTMTGESLKSQIDGLERLQEETAEGAPPALLAMWGDEKLTCVLEELTINRVFFDPTGDPLRAQANLTLVEFQERSESVDVQIRDVDDSLPPPK